MTKFLLRQFNSDHQANLVSRTRFTGRAVFVLLPLPIFQKVNNKRILLLSNYTVYFQFIFHRTFDLITEKKALTEVSKSRSRREIERERESERERRESLRDNDTAFIRFTPSHSVFEAYEAVSRTRRRVERWQVEVVQLSQLCFLTCKGERFCCLSYVLPSKMNVFVALWSEKT